MRSPRRQFYIGLLCGMSATVLFYNFVYLSHYRQFQTMQIPILKAQESLREINRPVSNLTTKDQMEEDKHMLYDYDIEAQQLSKQVRFLVWVMTSPGNLGTRVKAIKETWGKRCEKILFFSSEDNAEVPTIGLNTSEGRNHLTAKIMQGYRYVYKHFFDDYDWFVKTDDDTYVIVENLRYFLSRKNTSEPIYFGHLFKTRVEQGYYSGSTEVLSKEALRRLAEQGNDSTVCEQDGIYADVKLGLCMMKLGVKTTNSFDPQGRSLFHALDPPTFLFGKYPPWYYDYDPYGGKRKGRDSISKNAISFHYVNPERMIEIDFYIYHLQPYGLNCFAEK